MSPVPYPAPGTRICVVGTSGSGKTTVAERLADILGLRYIDADAITWRADWQETPDDVRFAETTDATREDGWTYDTNLGASLYSQLVLSRCDTLVWLDLPRWQAWSQMSWRTLSRLLLRTKLWHGNVESWRMLFSRDSIVLWSLTTYSRRRRQYAALFADPAHAHRTLIRLRSRREVGRWLASLAKRGSTTDRNWIKG